MFRRRHRVQRPVQRPGSPGSQHSRSSLHTPRHGHDTKYRMTHDDHGTVHRCRMGWARMPAQPARNYRLRIQQGSCTGSRSPSHDDEGTRKRYSEPHLHTAPTRWLSQLCRIPSSKLHHIHQSRTARRPPDSRCFQHSLRPQDRLRTMVCRFHCRKLCCRGTHLH
jgi:hypothetical protein